MPKTITQQILSSDDISEKCIQHLLLVWKKYILNNIMGVGKIYFELTAMYTSDKERLINFLSHLFIAEEDTYFQKKSTEYLVEKVEQGYFKPKLDLNDFFHFLITSIDGITRDLILSTHYNMRLWLSYFIFSNDCNYSWINAHTILHNLVFNGLIAPVTEELYFRGFLLPRMERLGKLAPIVNVMLFSLYHLFSPWENITRIIALMPYVSFVWYKRNIKIGIATYCTLNTLSAIGLFLILI